MICGHNPGDNYRMNQSQSKCEATDSILSASTKDACSAATSASKFFMFQDHTVDNDGHTYPAECKACVDSHASGAGTPNA